MRKIPSVFLVLAFALPLSGCPLIGAAVDVAVVAAVTIAETLTVSP